MSESVWMIIVAAVVAIAIVVTIVILSRRRKRKLGEAAPEEIVPSPEEVPGAPEVEPEEEVKPASPEEVEPTEEAAPEKVSSAAPEITPVEAPGVRLDDKAEEEAAARLEQERRERKLKRLRQGLAPTRGGFIKKIGALFRAKKEIEPSLMEDLEETLITSDVGIKTTEWLIDILKRALDKKELNDSGAVWDLLREEVRQVLSVDAPPIEITSDKPHVILVVGVNGVGKTTTIGKLAAQFTEQGHQVVLAAADTFRAAAVNQLEIWGRRAGADIVKSKEGADPSSVVFDAIKKAKEQGADIVIADTAGRLHTKVPLMEEIKKVARVAGKAQENAPHQVLLVLDATTGQNAISQVAMFKEAVALSGLVVTKLDGTAKGGVIIGICYEHKIPIRFIGIGEAKDDLREFEINDFVEVLFSENNDNNNA
ncbi:MAG: signal recognition particle-docking protein FtsY [Proteobacteria bacterium]|nr:signal recognition particle-docking protein FtsY [Pseudomonadota bacterium]